MGIAKVVLFKRDHVAVVRPYDGMLLATALTYAEHFKKPTAFKDEIPHLKTSSKELELAKTLMDVLRVKEFDFSEYKDPYRDRVMELVQSKVSGQAVEVPEEEEAPAAINFMEADNGNRLADTRRSRPHLGHLISHPSPANG